jgi:ankyrin repeat protein
MTDKLIFSGIHLDLREVIWSSQVAVHTKLAAHSKVVDDIRAMVQHIAGQNTQRSRSRSESSSSTIRSSSSDDTLVARSINSLDLEENSPKETVCFMTTFSTTGCLKSCSCTCHSTALIKFPRWMNQVTGLLFMRYSGTPLLTAMKCSKKRCKERHQSKIHASYYFPGWLLHRMIEVVARWDANATPTMNLRVMRVIPDQSPLFSCAMEGRTSGIRDLFLQNLASPIDIRESDGRSALHIALYNGHPSTAQFLLDQGADRNYKDKYFQSAVGACWEISFQKLRIPVIEPCVIGGTTEYSDYLDERGLTPVHKIVLGISSVSLDDYLLSLSAADIDKKDVMGKTPLHFAAVRGDLDAVSTLLQHEADPNVKSDALWTPLHEAAISSNYKSFQPLLMAGAHVDALNSRGQTALSMAAHVRDDPRYFDYLLEYNTNIHLADENGLTPLHRTCVRNRVESARRLIALKADIDALDNKHLSPVHTCVLNNSHDVLNLLLDAGARVDRSAANGRTLLHDVAAVGNLRTISTLSNAHFCPEGLSSDSVDAEGRTAQEVFNCARQTSCSESDEERAKSAFAFRALLDRIREWGRFNQLSKILSEKWDVQSTISDEEFFEAMERMESSVESLHTTDGFSARLMT